MKSYTHNISVYAAQTRHLSMIEHGAYRLLLDMHYKNGLPLGLEGIFRKTGARTEAEREAVNNVLQDYFERTQNGWAHK
jgi:uncharacterized protein YdaU (DUF1376 family)